MKHRVATRLPHRVTINRRSKVGETQLGEPQYEWNPVATDVPCAVSDSQTSFIREETGERVRRPATIRFKPSVDVQEGDRIEIDGFAVTYEVTGIDIRRDHRRGVETSITAEVTKIDW